MIQDIKNALFYIRQFNRYKELIHFKTTVFYNLYDV